MRHALRITALAAVTLVVAAAGAQASPTEHGRPSCITQAQWEHDPHWAGTRPCIREPGNPFD